MSKSKQYEQYCIRCLDKEIPEYHSYVCAGCELCSKCRKKDGGDECNGCSMCNCCGDICMCGYCDVCTFKCVICTACLVCEYHDALDGTRVPSTIADDYMQHMMKGGTTESFDDKHMHCERCKPKILIAVILLKKIDEYRLLPEHVELLLRMLYADEETTGIELKRSGCINENLPVVPDSA
jgi:hypothetical protein